MSPLIGYLSIAVVVLSTVLIGFFGLRISRTTGDFYVASRTVRPWWNASVSCRRSNAIRNMWPARPASIYQWRCAKSRRR